MDLHPVFVHFPIALLIVYSLLECLRSKKNEILFNSKLILLVIGLVGAFFALSTGDIAEKSYSGSDVHKLIEIHATFAGISTYIYGLITLIYLVYLLNKMKWNFNNGIDKILLPISNISLLIFEKNWIMISMAIIGLIAIVITGGLGGLIVYGPTADPFFAYFYKIIF
jgi:uncharacterized membrane protein